MNTVNSPPPPPPPESNKPGSKANTNKQVTLKNRAPGSNSPPWSLRNKIKIAFQSQYKKDFELYKAVYSGDLPRIEDYIRRGANPAAEILLIEGTLESVKKFLTLYPMPDMRGQNYVKESEYRSTIALLQWLLNNKLVATLPGYIGLIPGTASEMVRVLEFKARSDFQWFNGPIKDRGEKPRNIVTHSMAYVAAMQGHMDIVTYLAKLSNTYGEDALKIYTLAIENGNLELATLMFKNFSSRLVDRLLLYGTPHRLGYSEYINYDMFKHAILRKDISLVESLWEQAVSRKRETGTWPMPDEKLMLFIDKLKKDDNKDDNDNKILNYYDLYVAVVKPAFEERERKHIAYSRSNPDPQSSGLGYGPGPNYGSMFGGKRRTMKRKMRGGMSHLGL